MGHGGAARIETPEWRGAQLVQVAHRIPGTRARHVGEMTRHFFPMEDMRRFRATGKYGSVHMPHIAIFVGDVMTSIDHRPATTRMGIKKRINDKIHGFKENYAGYVMRAYASDPCHTVDEAIDYCLDKGLIEDVSVSD
jgi:hypothetical protein